MKQAKPTLGKCNKIISNSHMQFKHLTFKVKSTKQTVGPRQAFSL